MPHHGAFVQKFLVVEFLRQHFLFACAPHNRALIGKQQLSRFNQFPRAEKRPRFPYHFHIQKQHARIDIVVIQNVFSVMVARRGILHPGYVYIVQQRKITVEHDIRVKVQNFIGNFGNFIRKQS